MQNWTSIDSLPNPVHDLCVLELEPITSQAWAPSLLVSDQPLASASSDPSGDFFVIGSPQWLIAQDLGPR